MSNLLHFSYWFATFTPPFRKSSFIITLIVLGLFFAGGIVFKVLAKKNKVNPPLARGLSRLARPLLFFSIASFVLVWFRQLGAGIISARAWLVVIFLIAVVWFVFSLRAMLKTYKAEYQKISERRKYEAYLPKKRK